MFMGGCFGAPRFPPSAAAPEVRTCGQDAGLGPPNIRALWDGRVEMIREQTLYFEPGETYQATTREVIACASEYLAKHRLKHLVAASCRGYTGAQLAPLRRRYPKLNLVAVKMATGVDAIHKVKFDEKHRKTMQANGITLIGGTHAITGGLDRAIRDYLGGWTANNIVAETLYLFSQGMKVCVEVIAMAVDAGAVPKGAEVIAIAGTGRGADTAIVATASGSTRLFEMDIHKVLAMPLRG
jgi:hypothetical protein